MMACTFSFLPFSPFSLSFFSKHIRVSYFLLVCESAINKTPPSLSFCLYKTHVSFPLHAHTPSLSLTHIHPYTILLFLSSLPPPSHDTHDSHTYTPYLLQHTSTPPPPLSPQLHTTLFPPNTTVSLPTLFRLHSLHVCLENDDDLSLSLPNGSLCGPNCVRVLIPILGLD